MIAAALLLQAAAMPPQDWTALPIFPMPRAETAVEASAFVRREVAGGCKTTNGPRLAAPVAILVDASGVVSRIVPRAIGCPTVEQFTVGYLSSLTRGGPGTALRPKPGWYRLTVTYRW